MVVFWAQEYFDFHVLSFLSFLSVNFLSLIPSFHSSEFRSNSFQLPIISYNIEPINYGL